MTVTRRPAVIEEWSKELEAFERDGLARLIAVDGGHPVGPAPR